MKVFSISVILAPPSGSCTVLSSANDLSSYSFYQKGSVGEFMTFFSRTVAERTAQGQRQSIQENNYTAYVYNRGGAEQLAGMSASSLNNFVRSHRHQALLLLIKNILSAPPFPCSQSCWTTSQAKFPSHRSAILRPFPSPTSIPTFRSIKIPGRPTPS